MAQLISVKLSRFEGSPWGFRLQGGKDFGTPLIVQKVNGGSPAEAAGLKAGDAVIRVNNTDMFNLRHKDAQDVIVRAGNSFEVTVQRGGSTWKPSVTPISSALPSPTPSIPANNVSPVTKTSLAAKKNDGPLIGSGHNFSPKPFLNGSSEGPIKSIVNKQYNSPVGIYSEETIAETLSAQAEVLAGGVLGVNFKKNEKNYNAQNSEVFKMVQEADKEPRTPEPVPSRTEFYSSVSHAVGGQATSPRSPTPLSRALGLCQTVSNSYETSSHQETQRTERRYDNSSSSYTPSDTPICHNCDNAIVGVFVRIKDKNLHVDCFKCSTCGTSLKNVGYYNINEKLYCDIHAKMVARQQAPSSLTPVTVQLGSKAPAGTISAALSNIGPLSPSLSNHGSSPQPFSSCHRINSDSRLADHQTSLKMNGKTTNGYLGENESNGTSKTYTSTITIQTGHKEVCNVEGELDYNRNPTNLKARYKFDEINEIQFDPIISDNKNSKNATSHCTEKILTSYPQQPTRLGTSIVDSPSLRPVQAPTSNNIGGSKLYGGSSFNTPNYSSPPTYNSGSSTLPRPQSQTVTGVGIGGLGSNKSGSFAGSSAPKRGKGILNQASGAGSRVPLCGRCNNYVRGPFITALGQIWCPEHFVCGNAQCSRGLQDIGFVEEKGQLYCEYCFEKYIAPPCNKCGGKIKGDCLNAVGKHYHPECFNCSHCGKLFGNSPFFLEDGLPYCENDWNNLFTTKCFACGFPVEAGDRWVEALNNNYHSQCFNCTMCKKNLEGQSFYAKAGRPFCKNHAR
ncbi:PDZ and LIM domain protein Zasp isoform X9 [Belonocnema kinseyi]|uniref:PDZ and LIM domain protein Zasp isoform X9 n=1 Tax=Belonocnema kinseyi TaxID=2817044 RepID=UPI00143D3E17|nr:PDZ and LIM domain protein Zasp isoform X9 [Belonocnema kinseyi]